MPRKRFSTEQIITKLRQAEVALGRGLRPPQVCKQLGISEQTYYRWRKEYGGRRLGAGNEEEPPLPEQDGAIEPREYDRDAERQYVDGVSDGSPCALRGGAQRLCRFFDT